MATTKITIKNGKIVDSNETYVETIKPYYAKANGWEVFINTKKDIIYCEKVRQYSYGEAKKKKIFKLEDGLLGLSGGRVEESYAYFRSERFQNFLSEYGITAVSRLKQDENGIFKFDIRNANYGAGKCESWFWTDGEVTRLGIDSGFTEEWQKRFPGTQAYEDDTYFQVKNARFVVIEQTQHERDAHNHSKILYTNEDVYSLELDKILKESGRCY